MRVLLIGHGRMGQLVERVAASHGVEIAGVITAESGEAAVRARDYGPVHAAIDFSEPAAVPVNLPLLIERGVNVVVGTTGWQDHEAAMRALVERSSIGVMAAANFSIGMAVFRAVVTEAARRFAGWSDVGAWIHETHHDKKKDAPSGTAIMLKAAMTGAGYTRTIDVSSTRAGSVPGRHTVGFDAPSETVTLTHDVRDRSVFAHGALLAAAWLQGRRGWFTMDDMVKATREAD